MPDNRPLVWIATPLRHFEHSGLLTKNAFEELGSWYKEPIRELCALRDLPWRIELFITGGGSVFRARNRFTSEFVAAGGSPDDKLLMVDYDLMPTASDYVRILSHACEIVGGCYTIRSNNPHWVLNRFNGAVPHPNGTLQVMELGTGFKCFKRSVFTHVLKENPWLDCESDVDHSKRELCFFSAGPVKDAKYWPGINRCLTEDYWFDWLCRNEGIPTFVDMKVRLRHYDEDKKTIFPAVFPPDLDAVLA